MIGTRTRASVVSACTTAATIGIVLAGCSSGSEPSPSNTSASPTPTSTTSTVVFDQTIQQELKDVGCYQGNVDGIMGPETDAAIVAFQRADGLPVDGELGPQTDAALKSAANEGRTVCSETTSPTTSPTSSPTVSPAKAPCTATAINAALPQGFQATSYVCAHAGDERWAAGDDTNGKADSVFILQAQGSSWRWVDRDEVCGTASAGIPPKILDYCDVN